MPGYVHPGIDTVAFGRWRVGMKKPEQLPPHVPAFLWTQLAKLSSDMKNNVTVLLPSGDLAIPPKALKRHFQDDLFHGIFLLNRG